MILTKVLFISSINVILGLPKVVQKGYLFLLGKTKNCTIAVFQKTKYFEKIHVVYEISKILRNVSTEWSRFRMAE